MEAIEELKLPKQDMMPKNARGGGATRGKKEISLKPHHLIQTIDLSGFRERRFSRSGLKELLDGLELLPCVRSINLSHNGITDDYDKEVLALFDMDKIKAIDLSFNFISKSLANMIGKKLSTERAHINWLDLTMNQFDNEPATIKVIIQGLKRQIKLQHVGLTVAGTNSDLFIKTVLAAKRPPVPITLNNRNSRFLAETASRAGKGIKKPAQENLQV